MRCPICAAVTVSILCLLVSVGHAGSTRIETNEAVDRTLQVFAHLDVGDSPASNFDAEYVSHIGSEITKQHEELARYVRQFENLQLLTIIPAYFSAADHLVWTLQTALDGQAARLNKLPPEEQSAAQGLQPFLSQLPSEALELFTQLLADTMVSDTLAEQKRLSWLEEFWSQEGKKAISSFFAANGFDRFWITASPAMRRNGRGFPGVLPRQAAAITLLPESRATVFFSYSLAVHEMIHQVTDGVVFSVLELQPEDRSTDPRNTAGMEVHILLENAVILTQYWLMEIHSPDWAENYLAFMSHWSGEVYPDLEALRRRFPVPPVLESALRDLLAP